MTTTINRPIAFKLELNGFTATSVDVFATTYYEHSDESKRVATFTDQKLARLVVMLVNRYLAQRAVAQAATRGVE